MVWHSLSAAQLLWPPPPIWCWFWGQLVQGREGVSPTSRAWRVGSWSRREAMASAGTEWMEHLLDCGGSESQANYLSMTLDVKHNWKAEILHRTQMYFKDSFVKGILRYITYITQKQRDVFKKLIMDSHREINWIPFFMSKYYFHYFSISK